MKKSLLLCTLLPVMAYANTDKTNNAEFTIGALAGFGSSAYAVDDKVSALPLFLYDNDFVYLEGADAGFYAYKDSKNWFRVGVSYDGRHFEPDDATISALKEIDQRKSSANIHLSYTAITPVGGFEAKVATDMMDRSGGQTASLAHRSRFNFMDDKLTIYPKFGVNWYSDDYNQYYYGVSQSESDRTGIAQYQAKSSVSPFASVNAKYKMTDHFGLFGGTKAEWLSTVQKDSPLTDGKVEVSANAGVTYTF